MSKQVTLPAPISANQRLKILVIVAHPDDETIWMGGTILKFSKVDWTILALCRASDPDRAPKFMKVCAHLGAKGMIEDLDDEGILTDDQAVPEIEKLLAGKINFSDFDLVFTHGDNGEYGHPGHINAHQAILNLAKDKKVSKNKLRFFHYRKKFPKKEFSQIIGRRSPDFILELSPELYKQKKVIVSDIYGFAPDGPDVGYCTNPECFKKFK